MTVFYMRYFLLLTCQVETQSKRKLPGINISGVFGIPCRPMYIIPCGCLRTRWMQLATVF